MTKEEIIFNAVFSQPLTDKEKQTAIGSHIITHEHYLTAMEEYAEQERVKAKVSVLKELIWTDEMVAKMNTASASAAIFSNCNITNKIDQILHPNK